MMLIPVSLVSDDARSAAVSSLGTSGRMELKVFMIFPGVDEIVPEDPLGVVAGVVCAAG